MRKARTPEGYPARPLSTIRATTAAVGGFPLLAVLINVTDKYPAIVAGVRAQDRDRIAREPAYHYLLRREFEEHGTKIRALNDRGDDTPEGELTDGILDQLGKYERAKISERSRRGNLQKAREGKVLAVHRPPYGFRYHDARDNYLVDAERMSVMERIFRMVGVEGYTMNATRLAFNREGVRPPSGEFWSPKYIREAIKDDVYRSHTYEEVEALVSPEVAARLDPKKRYGVWYFNRRRYVTKQVSVNGPEGRKYRRTTKVFDKPRSEWIAVPPCQSREYRASGWTPRVRPSRITSTRARMVIGSGNSPAASSTAPSAVAE